ncbi:MAG: PTS transporter subunit EIIC [Lactobacillaceae bacterium]|nr:PTS transporter subunit EIIC [Lactobacillaceae bacterium]
MDNKFMTSVSEHLLPVATKIGNNKFLVALRDSFIGTMPAVMTGSLALLINAFLVDIPTQFGWMVIPDKMQWLVGINSMIFRGTVSVVSLIFIYSLGVNVAKMYKTDQLSSGIVAFSAFIISIGSSVSQTFDLSKAKADLNAIFKGVDGITVHGGKIDVEIGSVIPGAQISSSGYFTAILIGFMAAIIFSKIMLKNWTIKLPASVPPAIAKPFLSIIPAFISLYSVAIFITIFNHFTGKLLIDWIYEVLQTPLLGMSQNFFAVIAIAFLTQLFWFFGIHGGNVMAPIMEGVFGVALLANLDAYQHHQAIPYLWTSVSYSAFVWYATLGLLIAIFWKSRDQHYREVAKLGLAPVLFNIGEPVMYGLPTVLNPILMIPFLLCPIVLTAVSYAATVWGLVAPVTQNITWVMPPVLYGFFATAFDWRAIVLSLINLALATFIYLPFVMMNNKQVEQDNL